MPPVSFTVTAEPSSSVPPAAQIVEPTVPNVSGAPAQELRVVLPGLMLAMTLAALDQNIVNTALPRIVSDLGGLSHMSWVVTAFLLASTATTPLYGKLSDTHGRRPMFFIAITVFLIGSMACGTARTMLQLVLFRGLQGLGAGGLMTLAQTTIADLIPARERGRYQGLFGGVFAACSVAGPLLGGILTDALSWRWIFYVNLPVGGAALALIGTGLKHHNKRVERQIDYRGAALLTVFTTTLLLVLSWGGSVYPWSSPEVLGTAGAVLVSFALLVPTERAAAEPILPPGLFGNRVFVIAASVIALNSVALFGALMFLPLFFQLVLQHGASGSGLMMAPLMAGVIFSSVVGGRMVSRTGRYKSMTIGGLALAAVTLVFLGWAARGGAGAAPIEVALVAMGLGLGLVMPNLTVAIQNSVPKEDLGVATSASAYCRSLGGGVGVAMAGALLTAGLSHGTVKEAGQGLAQIASLPPAVQAQVLEAYRSSLSFTFGLAACVITLALVLLCALPEVQLRGRDGV